MPLIQFRRGSTAEWTAVNPTLADGEPGYALPDGPLKIGNGIDPWLDLAPPAGSARSIRELYQPLSKAPIPSDMLGAEGFSVGTALPVYADPFQVAPWTAQGSKFRVLGGPLVQGVNASAGKVAHNGSVEPDPCGVEFNLLGGWVVLQIALLEADGGALHVHVDGMTVTALPHRETATNILYVGVQLSSVRQSTIRVDLGRAQLMQIIYPTSGDIWPAARRRQAAITGDSFTTGQYLTAANGGNLFHPLGHYWALRTGWEFHHIGQGGTGYVNPSDGTDGEIAVNGYARLSHSSRLNALDALPADLEFLVVSAGTNDAALTGIQAAATATYAAIYALRPELKLIVQSPYPATFDDALEDAAWAAIKTAALAAPNVVALVDMRDPAWVVGTGNRAAPAGDGNRDVHISGDDIHPESEGYEYLATRAVGVVGEAKV